MQKYKYFEVYLREKKMERHTEEMVHKTSWKRNTYKNGKKINSIISYNTIWTATDTFQSIYISLISFDYSKNPELYKIIYTSFPLSESKFADVGQVYRSALVRLPKLVFFPSYNHRSRGMAKAKRVH